MEDTTEIRCGRKKYMIWNKKVKKRSETRSASEEGIIEFINLDRYSMSEDKNARDYLVPEKINLPEWYKKLPITAKLYDDAHFDDLTAKRCIPILDAMTTGYVFVTTVDYHFDYEPGKNYGNFSGPEDIMSQKPISMHPLTQISTLNPSPEYIDYAYKWGNTWTVKTPPGYSCMFIHPLNGVELPFKSLDGVVDTDNYFQPVLFPFLMKNNFNGVIPAGTPVIQVIPFKRDNWKMKINDKINEELINNYKSERQLYEGQRYGRNMEIYGGMYKRDYRVKKKYL